MFLCTRLTSDSMQTTHVAIIFVVIVWEIMFTQFEEEKESFYSLLYVYSLWAYFTELLQNRKKKPTDVACNMLLGTLAYRYYWQNVP